MSNVVQFPGASKLKANTGESSQADCYYLQQMEADAKTERNIGIMLYITLGILTGVAAGATISGVASFIAAL